MKNHLLLFIFLYTMPTAWAQTSDNCVLPTAYTTLDINNVRAGIGQGSVLWWDQNNKPTYEVKGSGVNSLFAGGLWIGGLDEKDTLYVSNTTYNVEGIDFRPGPIGISTDDQAAFNRHWKINQSTIDSFKTGLFTDIPTVILEWPGTGNPALSFLPDQDLAPFEDVNNDGIYKATDGDYPLILGDQSIWYVYSDGNCNNSSSTLNEVWNHDRYLGIDVQTEAFAYATVPGMENITFYKLKIINRSSNNYHDVFMGNFIDVDLGFYRDDFMGTDIPNKLTYCYNGRAIDAEFGADIPMVGAQILKSPVQSTTRQEAPFSASLNYIGDWSLRGDPIQIDDFYNFLQGKWKNETPVTEGGSWINGEVVTTYMFADPPNDPDGISECTENNTADDRRFLQSVGPFDLESGTAQTFFFAIIWTDEVVYPCPDITPLTDLAKEVQAYFDTSIAPKNQLISTLDPPHPTASIAIYPNPAREVTTIHLAPSIQYATIQIVGINGQLLAQYTADHRQKITIPRPINGGSLNLVNLYDVQGELVKSEKVVWE